MKKLLSLILCTILTLSLFAGCESAPVHTLRVGYGRVDITPEESVPLRGYGNTSQRMSTEVSDPLYATCIAFTDEKDNTVLLFYTDLISGAGDCIVFARSDISKATGVPMNNIFVSGTHMHSGPDLFNSKESSIDRYSVSLRKWLLEAALAAMEDRKEAELSATDAYPVGYNAVRHYYLEDGRVRGDNFGPKGDIKIVGHVSEADNQLQLVKITREGGDDIVLVNWQGHPHRGGGKTKTNITADLVGAMRDYMEDALGCKVAYFTGASGNTNSSSRIASENAVPKGSATAYITHGQQLGQIAIDALKNCTPVQKGAVQALTEKITLETRNASPREVTVWAFSVGDIGFAIAPYEMFSQNGNEIKAGSNFGRTFVVTCANGGLGYIPSIGTWDYHTEQYPVYEIKNCTFAAGAGEKLSAQYVSMLNKLNETKS